MSHALDELQEHGAPASQSARKRDLLPPGDELVRQLSAVDSDGKSPTLQNIADRYGTSRQAVFKRIKKWREQQRREATKP